MKTIGILTSGGDSPGMNACIAAVVRRSEVRGLKSVGILRGFEGLVGGSAMQLDAHSVSGIAGRGGTILETSRDGSLKARLEVGALGRMFAAVGIDALIVLGGGGSISAARGISDAGLPVIAVPCTIDNDIAGTDYTIGFDSACNRVIAAANDIADTAESLGGRIFLIETLGGESGHIAISSAYAIGADAVLVPEIKPDLPVLCGRLKAEMDAGKTYVVIVVAEGAGPAPNLIEPIAELVGRRVRVTALGHAQRGGPPTYWDRKMARAFGERAVDLLIDGECDAMTALAGGVLTETPMSVPVSTKKPLDEKTYELINTGAKLKAGG
ncbi:MAG: ATP-dependent 6-phosphofructokinase [Armatimonadota bacterium]|nr:ATP-dependent 6-phosphofructokinase [Armatimonadota bacterium]